MKGGRERLRAMWAGVVTVVLIYFAASPFLGPQPVAGILFGLGLAGVVTLSSKEGIKRQAALLSRVGRAGTAIPGAFAPPGPSDPPASRAPLRSGAGHNAGSPGDAVPRGPGPLGAAGIGGRVSGAPPEPEVIYNEKIFA